MDKTILISLSGHTEQYRLEAAAHDRLQQYLDGAAAGLRADPDQAEILADLERAVGDKLAVLLGGTDRLVTVADIEHVVEEIGSVDAGRADAPPEPAAPAASAPPRPVRRLTRIRRGQQLAGVCNGIAAYAQLDVSWVRVFFLAATVVTAGAFALVYAALAFILPVAEG